MAGHYLQPGVHVPSAWYPDRVPVGVDFYPPYIAAHALRSGLSIYDDLHHRGGPFADAVAGHEGLGSRFTYPPPLAYLYLPVSWLPVAAAWKVHTVAAIAGLTLALWLLTRLAGGGPGLCLALAALCAVFYPLYFALVCGNVALWCFVLLVLALYWSDTGSGDLPAGVCLALSVVVKLYPALFLVHFALRRRWRVLGYTCVALLLFVALTAQGGAYPRFFERAREFDHFVQAWHLNGSFFGVLAMRGVSFGAAYWMAKFFAFVVIGAALLAVGRRPQAGPYDAGLLSAAMILAPNTNYDYNLIFLLPGVAALLAAARLDRRPTGPLLLAAAAFFALAVPTQWVANALRDRGLHGHLYGPLASKFPWLLLFYAALLWGRLQAARGHQPHSGTATG